MNADLEDLTAFRRDLHTHPEVSGEEYATATRVLDRLRPLRPDGLLEELGGTGILATFGSDGTGPQVLLRCELDALPIREVNTFGHRSIYDGVSHKCGHDGHMAMLTGVAMRLAADRPKQGRVHLLYQPAEENGAGAKAVLKDPRMGERQFDLVLALHNLPGYPLGSVVVREGAFTASVNSMVFVLEGKTSHAAEPEHGLNPAAAVAELLQGALALDHNVPEDPAMRVMTPVHVKLGSVDYGISAGHAEVHLTLRCWNDEELRNLEQETEDVARRIAREHGLELSLRYTHTFQANMNDAQAARLVRETALATGHQLVERGHPFKWGEDFGLFTARFPGCMFGLGSGEQQPALHNPDYDFPDGIIPHGIAVFERIIRQH
ncbi:MAG: amidohydrolase [Flavobacteriales bacterium]|nr:amidohydrolase [Flavobacteriales bacterium]